MGAYDLERSKYYDAINSVPRVTLDNNDYNIDYIKRAGFIARVRIAESFDGSKEYAPTLAGSNYSNAVEMFQKLLDEGGEGRKFELTAVTDKTLRVRGTTLRTRKLGQ